jgi:hypothetical protein
MHDVLLQRNAYCDKACVVTSVVSVDAKRTNQHTYK